MVTAPVGVKPETLAARIARRIEDEVIALGWPIGRNLGAETSLQERFGVSRSVLREAVRLVEHHQVAAMRRGPGGGLFVTAPDATAPTRAMLIYLTHVGTTIDHMLYARQLLEPIAAALAAERLTEAGIARLRSAAEEGRAPGSWSDPVHVLLGELSGNPALRLFIDILTRLSDRYTLASSSMALEAVKASRHHHELVADAVIAGDAALAETRLADHLAEVGRWLQEARRVPAVRTALNDPPLADGKLAETLADRILREVVSGQIPAGTVLGSESELLARYDVSRTALREAVRLLEYHSVARMRRGPGGGLVVTTPATDATVETMALYLDHQSVTGEDLRVVREAIELGALQLVSARRHDPEVAARLHAVIARTCEPPGDGPNAADLFHIELAELAGNPVLVLFQRILTELWARHSADQIPTLPDGASAEVARLHERVLTALLNGDEGLARHRMRRHLEALTAWWH